MSTPNAKAAGDATGAPASAVGALFDVEQHSLDAAARACTSLIGSLAQAQAEWLRFLSERFAKDARVMSQLAACRNPADVAQLQLQLGSEAAGDYLAETRKLVDLFGRAAGESAARAP